MTPKIHQKYLDILQVVEPYVLSYPGSFDSFDMNPWSFPIQHKISCLDHTQAKFFDLLHSLDGVSFGPMGMPMDKWVFYDCGEMPGAVVGFGVRAERLDRAALEEFKIDASYQGIIPISMYIAIPIVGGKLWFGHNLSSANRVLQVPLEGLGLLTKVYGLKVMRIEEMLGATQWDSKALEIHLQIADMELVSAYTPAHSFVNTMTYRSLYTEDVLLQSLKGVKRESEGYDFLAPPDDPTASLRLQERITKGERFVLNGRPIQQGGKAHTPIKII